MKWRILKLGRGLFHPPVFAEEEKNLTIRQIYPILWTQIFSVIVIGVLLSLLDSPHIRYWFGLTVSMVVVSLALLALARSGRAHLASFLLVAQLWLLITFFSWTSSGLGARAAWGYFIVVFIAGMLLGRWLGVMAAAICSLSTLLLAIASPVRSNDPIRFWLINTLYLVLVLLLQNLASRSIHESLDKAKQQLRERQQAEAALVQSERKYREMVNALPFCVFEMDFSGRITFVNKTGVEWFGYSENEFLSGMSVFQILENSDEDRARENLRHLMAGEELPYSEYQVRCKDGSIFTVLIRSRLLLEGGVPYGVQGSLIDIRERKRAEKEKEQMISLLKATIESTADGIMVIDHAGRITAFNQRFSRMWCIPDAVMETHDDAQALNFVLDQLVDPQMFTDKVQMLHANPEQESFDLLRCKDGRLFERYSRPQMIAGQPLGRVWSFRDVTDRRLAEAALRESEEKYRKTMDVAPMGIYIIQDMRFKFVNLEMARMHGYVPEEMIDSLSPPDDLVAPEYREMVRQSLLHRQADMPSQSYEIRARCRDGSFFDALVWGQGISFNGKPASVGTILDISKRKQAERALMESEQRYHTLFEAAYDAIFVMKGNLFFDCNSRTLEMYGCRAEQIIGVSPDRFSPPLQPDGRNSLEKALEKIQAAYAGVPQFFEWLHCRADGTPFITEVSLNRFELASGPHLLAIVRDIADRKALEEQLRQAQKMEAVGILAGGVAHDFNNILSTIVGYASLLQMHDGLESKLKEYLERILASTERAASLTHSLLAFSRKQAIELQPVDINDSIYGFHKVLARLIGEDIDFRVSLASESLVVDADIRQIEQVLMNLATNSRDAMPQGGMLLITTRAEVVEKGKGEMPNGSYAVISVSDTGTGMDTEIQSHLFEPFFTTKEVGKGTGLGLAIVYGIIKNHKGFIRMESTSKQGTAFHIYLPLKLNPVLKSKGKLQAKIPRGNETILLVEDDVAVRQATRSMLEEFGYTVLEAVDGQDALDVFERNRDRIHLLLSDLIMPKKNGKETQAALIKLKPDLKTIFMSGYTSDIIARKGIHEPGMHLLLKPLHPAVLLEKIRQVLDEGAG